MKLLMFIIIVAALYAATAVQADGYLKGKLAYDDKKQAIIMIDIQGVTVHVYDLTFQHVRFITNADTCFIKGERKPCRDGGPIGTYIANKWPRNVIFRCEITKTVTAKSFEVSTCQGSERRPDGTLIRDYYFPGPHIAQGMAFALTQDGRIDLDNVSVKFARTNSNGVWGLTPELATPTAGGSAQATK